MPQIGSFALLLALALAAYSFLAGALALYRKDDRLGETARRAGIACWAAVTVAAVALVMAALRQRLLGRLHPAPQQPRPAHRLQVRRAVVGPGRLAAVLGVAAVDLRAGAAAALQGRSATDGVCLGDHRRGAGLLPAAGELRGASVRPGQRHRFPPTATA